MMGDILQFERGGGHFSFFSLLFYTGQPFCLNFSLVFQGAAVVLALEVCDLSSLHHFTCVWATWHLVEGKENLRGRALLQRWRLREQLPFPPPPMRSVTRINGPFLKSWQSLSNLMVWPQVVQEGGVCPRW